MKITFILPHAGHNPIGGFKVVYEYANAIVNKGHAVSVVHAPNTRYGTPLGKSSLRNLFVYAGRLAGVRGGFRPSKWFTVDPRVKMLWVPSLCEKWVPAADVIIATAWDTSEWVARFQASRGRKYYLIQHQESIFPGVDPVRAMATWKLPLKKIVIARWLEVIARSLGEDSMYIPNGLDMMAFGVDIAPESRASHKLLMLYHDHPWKGSNDGIAALCRAKERVPELEATLFGVPARAPEIPTWINYMQKPTHDVLRKSYNEAAIFVSPSWAEGWPLPPAEAAQCGAALCLTDIGGHREYAVHDMTALLSEPKNHQALAGNIVTLIRDSRKRITLAMQANRNIQQFTWDRSADLFEKCILG